MYDLFFRKFNEKVALTAEEEAFVKQYLTPKKLRRKQYFLQEGDVCKSICFVEKGALRAYVLDETGDEHITAFALEGWTLGDLYSFIKAEPATWNIDALEDCELILLSKQAHDELLQTMPKYETYIRLLMTDAYMALQRRTTYMISLPLEERYLAFNQMYPTLFQRIPQHMIASFMGLSAETLSRVRSRISNRK
ncbi:MULTISPECIES: Crp/Fnr family transcriptional regulator [Niastella]|uniref:Crp/Fnr family transcriptional regulator n=1 Tax=Niastella soli TaxID=2821487 RepID=A0ABS3YYY1_9BACT|nr:Crp/Fnr family transcriptional regulator [Niastella soli]MBO9202361.1 Crp/Fnr family transcriptional regulator [Niastella soli]